MTKNFTLLFTLLISFTVSGQIKKASNLLGGEIFYSQFDIDVSSEDEEIKTFVIGISYGRVIKDNLVLGLQLGISPLSRYTSTSNSGNAESNITGFGIAPYIRKYKSLGSGFFAFGQVDAHFGMSTIKSKNINPPDTEQRSWSTGIAVATGFAYQVSRCFHVQLAIPGLFMAEYRETREESNPPNAEDGSSKGFSVGSRLSNLTQLGYLNIGFYFIF